MHFPAAWTLTDAQCVPHTCRSAIFSSERPEKQSKSSFSPWPVICILYGQLVCHIPLLKTKHILLYRREEIDKHWWATSLWLNDNRSSNELKPTYVLITDTITEIFPFTLKALTTFIRTLRLCRACPDALLIIHNCNLNMKEFTFHFKRK